MHVLDFLYFLGKPGFSWLCHIVFGWMISHSGKVKTNSTGIASGSVHMLVTVAMPGLDSTERLRYLSYFLNKCHIILGQGHKFRWMKVPENGNDTLSRSVELIYEVDFHDFM